MPDLEQGSGGHTKFTPRKGSITGKELFGELCVCLAGTVAEDLFLNQHTALSNSDDMDGVMKVVAIIFSHLYVEVSINFIVVIAL